jgi:hypothetical protein
MSGKEKEFSVWSFSLDSQMDVGDNTYGHIWIPTLKRTYVEGFQQIIEGMCS